MIQSTGIDIVEIARVRAALARRPALRERLFTPAERAYCDRYPDAAPYYAARFAAKEAVAKAVGRHLRWQEVEIARDARGRPGVQFTGDSAEWAGVTRGAEFLVSLSHSREHAVAVVVQQFTPRPPDAPPSRRVLV